MAITQTLGMIKSLIHSHKFYSSTGGTLSVEEKGRQATLKAVHIVSVGSSAFAIKYDECGFPGTALFAAHDSLHRACDSVAFCEVDGEPFILCIELKSSEPTRHAVAQQFRNAHCFLDYLDSLLRNYCEKKSISTWPRRYFVFHNQGHTPLAKHPSRVVPSNTSPDNPLFIPIQTGEKIYLRKLLSKPS